MFVRGSRLIIVLIIWRVVFYCIVALVAASMARFAFFAVLARLVSVASCSVFTIFGLTVGRFLAFTGWELRAFLTGNWFLVAHLSLIEFIFA